MSTGSIRHNIEITDSADAERFVEALEKAKAESEGVMERLTEIKTHVTGFSYTDKKEGVFVQDVFDRLAAYEDTGLTPEEVQKIATAKAEGRLVVLPCKVGDTVYHRSGQHTIDDIQLFYPRQNGHVPEERIGKLQIRLGSLNYAGLQTFATYADEIGKTVFLTREAAEKALTKGAEHHEV